MSNRFWKKRQCPVERTIYTYIYTYNIRTERNIPCDWEQILRNCPLKIHSICGNNLFSAYTIIFFQTEFTYWTHDTDMKSADELNSIHHGDAKGRQ